MRLRTITLGCKVNQYETEALSQALCQEGYQRVGKDGPAELVLVNTCTVTGKAAMQSRQAIRRAYRENPEAFVVATGCYAQTEPEAIRETHSAHLIVGCAGKLRIPEWIGARPGSNESAGLIHSPVRPATFPAFPEFPVMSRRARQYLKIQDGCDAFCSYCIVPHARGSSRSLSPGLLGEHLFRLHALGAGEVVLTGIHLTRYGLDLSPETSLAGVLSKILPQSGIPRLRLSSLEPDEIGEELLHLFLHYDKLCPHFHLPLQSGDDEILAAMRRRYTSKHFADRVHVIKTLLPKACIGVDVLAGFPGETSKAFANTLHLLESLPVSYLHVFPFSPRKNTPAYSMKSQVDEREIKARCAALRQLSREKRRAFHCQMEGKTARMLVERKKKGNPQAVVGTTENYLPVTLTTADLPGRSSLIDVHLVGPAPDGTVLAVPR